MQNRREGVCRVLQALLEDMRGQQVAPSVVTYNILIDAYANEGWLEQVLIPNPKP